MRSSGFHTPQHHHSYSSSFWSKAASTHHVRRYFFLVCFIALVLLLALSWQLLPVQRMWAGGSSSSKSGGGGSWEGASRRTGLLVSTFQHPGPDRGGRQDAAGLHNQRSPFNLASSSSFKSSSAVSGDAKALMGADAASAAAAAFSSSSSSSSSDGSQLKLSESPSLRFGSESDARRRQGPLTAGGEQVSQGRTESPSQSPPGVESVDRQDEDPDPDPDPGSDPGSDPDPGHDPRSDPDPGPDPGPDLDPARSRTRASEEQQARSDHAPNSNSDTDPVRGRASGGWGADGEGLRKTDREEGEEGEKADRDRQTGRDRDGETARDGDSRSKDSTDKGQHKRIPKVTSDRQASALKGRNNAEKSLSDAYPFHHVDGEKETAASESNKGGSAALSPHQLAAVKASAASESSEAVKVPPPSLLNEVGAKGESERREITKVASLPSSSLSSHSVLDTAEGRAPAVSERSEVVRVASHLHAGPLKLIRSEEEKKDGHHLGVTVTAAEKRLRADDDARYHNNQIRKQGFSAFNEIQRREEENNLPRDKPAPESNSLSGFRQGSNNPRTLLPSEQQQPRKAVIAQPDLYRQAHDRLAELRKAALGRSDLRARQQQASQADKERLRQLLHRAEQINKVADMDTRSRSAKTTTRDARQEDSASLLRQKMERANFPGEGNAPKEGNAPEAATARKTATPDSGLDETGARKDKCRHCFHSNFPLLIDHASYCRDFAAETIVLLLISSAPSNSQKRQAVRDTWGGGCQDPHSPYRCLFVLGQSDSPRINSELREEDEKHGDLLQFGFKDAYSNLTLKTLTSLHWVASKCSQARYMMKTDDDMYVNTELIPVLLTAVPGLNFMGGYCWGNSPPNRDTRSKWFVPLKSFRHPSFPPMCSGTGYIMSRDVVSKVLTASSDIPFFHLEDVYVALCLQKLGNVHPVRITGFNNMLVEFDACNYRHRVMTSHEVPSDLLRVYWERIRSCPARSGVRGEDLFVKLPYPVL